MGKLQNMAQEGKFSITDTQYTDRVRVSLECPSEDCEQVKSLMADLTGGRAVLAEESETLGKYRINDAEK